MPRKLNPAEHVTRTFRFTKTTNDKLLAIHNKVGHSNLIATLIECINYKYDKEFDYVEIARQRMNQSPVDRVANRILAKGKVQNTLEEAKIENGRAVCHALAGTEIDINGNPHCDYMTYTEVGGKKVKQSSNRDPLDLLTEEAVNLQYRDILGESGPQAKEKLQALMENGGLIQ